MRPAIVNLIIPFGPLKKFVIYIFLHFKIIFDEISLIKLFQHGHIFFM